MLDEILAKAIREIATNCSIGCSQEELWHHLEDTVLSNNKKFKFTDTTKKYIHRLLLNHQSISLFPNPSHKEEEKNDKKEDNDKEQQQQQNEEGEPKDIEKMKVDKEQEQQKEQQDKEEEEESNVNKKEEEIKIKVEHGNRVEPVVGQEEFQTGPTKFSVYRWRKSEHESNKVKKAGLEKNEYLELSNRFVYCADKFNQIIALGVSIDQLRLLNVVQLKILERVSQSRFKGAIVRDLSNEFNIDPRNIFAPIKDLILKGVIEKEDVSGATGNSTISTGRLFLKKYWRPRYISMEREQWKPKWWVKAAMLHYIQETPGGITVSELLKKIGQTSQTTLKKNKAWLIQNRFIVAGEGSSKVGGKLTLEKGIGDEFWDLIEGRTKEAEDGDDGDEDGDDDDDEDGDGKSKKKTKTPTKKHATTPPATPATPGNTTATQGGEGDEDDTIKVNAASNLVMELPLYHQVFNIIRYAGRNGITTKEIANKVGEISKKSVSSVIKALILSYGIKCVPDTVGKQLMYRVYSDPKDYVNQDGDEKEDGGENDPNVLLRNMDQFKAHDTYRTLPGKPLVLDVNKNPHRLGSAQPLKPEFKQEINPHIEPHYQAVPVSVQFLKRKELVLKKVQDDRGCLFHTIIKHLRVDCAQPSVDPKTLKRIIYALISENKVSVAKLYTQSLRGTHRNLLFIYDSKYSLEDQEIQDIVEALKDLPVFTGLGTNVEAVLENEDQQEDEEEEEEQSEEDDEDNSDTTIKSKKSKPKSKSKSSTTTKTKLVFKRNLNSVGKRYGFIRGVIIRSKLLHQFIWTFATKYISGSLPKIRKTSTGEYTTKPEEEDNSTGITNNERQLMIIDQKELPETTKIFLNLFIKYLPISDYLKIISQNTIINGLDEHIEAGTLIIDLPQPIKNRLFVGRVFTSKLSDINAILQQLGLISRDISYGYTEYVFQRTAELMFEDGTIKKYDFVNFETLKTYWSDLQFISLLPKDKSVLERAPAQFICNRIPEFTNVTLWGVPRLALTHDIRQNLTNVFKNQPSSTKLTKENIKELSSRFNVSGYKILTFYKRFLSKYQSDQQKAKKKKKKKVESEDSENESEEETEEDDDIYVSGRGKYKDYQLDENGNKVKKHSIFKQLRGKRDKKREKQPSANTLATRAATARRIEIKKQILPYRRLKWTPLEDSQLLKKYTQVFAPFFANLLEGIKNTANSEYFITPSGIPSMLNPLWDTLGEECDKLGQLCYRRMFLLVKKYPSYKNFHKSETTQDLPLTIKEFNALFSYQYSKGITLDQFEHSKFESVQESLIRDKIFFLVSMPQEEYSYNLSLAITGTNKKDTNTVLESLLADKIIKNLKSKTTDRTINFCPQKIYFKSNSLNKEFFFENRVFMANIKEVPIVTDENDELFQYDPLTSGGSVSAMLYLFKIDKVAPVIELFGEINGSGISGGDRTDKLPRTRDLNGGQRLDFMVSRIGLSYQIKEYIDYSYIENERKRAINPDIIIEDDPYLADKLKFKEIYDQLDNDEEIDNGNSNKKRKVGNDEETTSATTSNDTLILDQLFETFNAKFKYQEFEELFKSKIEKINPSTIQENQNVGQFIGYLVLMIQEVFSVIDSNNTIGAKRIDIINHFKSSKNANSIIKDLIKFEKANNGGDNDYSGEQDDGNEEFTIDYVQYIYENLKSYILELKSLGIVDTVFTFYEKMYVSKQHFLDSLIPNDFIIHNKQSQLSKQIQYEKENEGNITSIETTNTITRLENEIANLSSLNFKDKKLIKPWVDVNGRFNRSLFNHMFIEFVTNVSLYPGSTLESISHRLQKYPPSMLKEAAIVLQSLDYIGISEFDYQPPTLFTSSSYTTKPFNALENDGHTNLIFNSKPKFFNLQADFSIYLITEDF